MILNLFKGRKGSIINHDTVAVVLDLSANGIGIIRSLGRRGIPIYAFDTERKYKIGKTRYATCGICPDPKTGESDLLALLIQLSERLPKKPVLFAGSDEFVYFISKNRNELSNYYHFLLPDHDLIEAVLDKRLTAILAEKHQIPSPKTFIVNNEAEIDQLIHNMSFPCILKPVFGHEFRKKLSKKAIIMENADQLRKEFPFYQQFGELLLQELIPGKEERIYQVGTLFDDNLQLIGLFMGQKLNQFPAYFGAGALVKSVRDEEVIEKGVSFLKALGFKGLSVAEFKRDPRDGQLKFIEINARTWLWHSLSGRCGVDLSYLYYLLLTKQNPEPKLKQTEGIKWIYLVRHYLSSREKRKKGDLTGSQWLRNLKGKKEYALFAWDDPLPFFRSAFSHLINSWKNSRQFKEMEEKLTQEDE